MADSKPARGATAGMEVTDGGDDIYIILLKYKTNDPEIMFDYVKFCANINAAFTTYGIQKVPTANVAPVTNDSRQTDLKYIMSCRVMSYHQIPTPSNLTALSQLFDIWEG